jgi:hypothetical protein
MNEKIQSEHRERTAFVYVRQSSGHQVREHREGQQRQYALADYARQLKFHKVTVIDDDLGRSGSGLQDRPGFARLLTAVCQGEAGAVLALEASRLARNNRDWHHLIDLCALTETLIIDDDGIYDPRQLNDRLLLGLKGSHFLKEILMPRNKAHPPPKQQVFAFARLDLWDKLPQAVRDECQRLIVQQLKQAFPSHPQQENVDEREDSI